MKALKSRNAKKTRGFTLIEVMIALTVTGLGLTPLFLSQGRLIKQTGRDFAEWESMIALKNFMYMTAQKQAPQEKKSAQEKIREESNGVTFSYDLFKPAENSSLKTIENIQLIKAWAEWNFFGQDTIAFVSAMAVPPEETESTEKEKKSESTASSKEKQAGQKQGIKP